MQAFGIGWPGVVPLRLDAMPACAFGESPPMVLDADQPAHRDEE
jgi:hypothetical protein